MKFHIKDLHKQFHYSFCLNERTLKIKIKYHSHLDQSNFFK